jgi:hypothetical protein
VTATGTRARAEGRPTLCTPESLQQADDVATQRSRAARQPMLGLAGLVLVLSIAVLLMFGAGGAETSVRVLGPIVTAALPLVAMVAFWWDDWPGTIRSEAWSGWIDTLLIAAGAIAFTVLGQVVVGRADLDALFRSAPGPGQAATTAVLPVAGAAFAAMLQLTLVCEGWPLHQLPRIPGGLLAIATAWIIAAVLYWSVVDVHPPAGSGLRAHDGMISGPELGALLTVIGVWQVWYITWRGWPFSTLRNQAARLALANLVVLGGGWLTYLILDRGASVATETITAAAGSFIAAGLIVSMLFEGAVRSHLTPAWDRVASVAVIAVLALLLYRGLSAFGDGQRWERITTGEWVTYATLDALGVSVILHTAVGRRWPFGDGTST